LKVPDNLSTAAKCPKCGVQLTPPVSTPAFEVVEDEPATAPAASAKPARKPVTKAQLADEDDCVIVDAAIVQPASSGTTRKHKRDAEQDESEDKEDQRPKKARRNEDDDDERRSRRGKKDKHSKNNKRGKRGLLFAGIGAVVIVVAVVGFIVIRYISGVIAFAGEWPVPKAPGMPMPGANESVTLHIVGVEDESTVDAISEWIDDHTQQVGRAGTYKAPRLTVIISPVKNAEEFAKKIDFGRVYSVSGNIISIYGHKLEGPPTEPVARALHCLNRRSTHTRHEGLRLLAATPPDNRREEIVKVLEPLLDDPEMRDGAVEALCAWGTKENAPLLIKAIKSDHTGARAIETLGRWKDERAIVPIVSALEPFVTQHAAKAALIGFGPAAEDAVLKVLEHPDDRMRAVACQVLQKIGGARSIEPVAACVISVHSRNQASEALVAFGPAAEDAVIKLLVHTDNNVRTAACELLIKIGTQKCMPALERTAQDPDFFVGSIAKTAIMRITERLKP
jgi:hypothetical protein